MSCTVPPLFSFVGNLLPVLRVYLSDFEGRIYICEIFRSLDIDPKSIHFSEDHISDNLVHFNGQGNCNMFFQIKHGLAHCYSRVGVYLARRSVQHLVGIISIIVFTMWMFMM